MDYIFFFNFKFIVCIKDFFKLKKVSMKNFIIQNLNQKNQETISWELIQEAGCADLAVGDAFLSKLHSNFIINRGSATAYQIELLGERVRKTVMEETGVNLEWEIRRLGHGPSINL